MHKPLTAALEYPKGYEENISFRYKLINKANCNAEFKELVIQMFNEDVLFAFNVFFYTLDVRRRPYHNQPFCTYKYQDDLVLDIVRCLNNGHDLVVEKSRDMGLSWIVICVFLWYWLKPEGGADFLLGSRIEDYVDKKGDMRALMVKARYALYKLPKWLRPKGFEVNRDDNYMRLKNPATGASITGESNNANFSTGGRYLGILYDEFAKWEMTDTAAWTAGGDATPCRIAVSTPFGAAGQYYNLVTDGRTLKRRLHWSIHPIKGDGLYCVWPIDLETGDKEMRAPWYDKECERRSPLEIDQELNINYIGSGAPVFDGKAGKRMIKLLKTEIKPLSWMTIDFASLGLKSAPQPRESEGHLVIYERPEVKNQYVLGVDVAEGKEGGDFSIVKVYSRLTKSIAASYASRIDEVQLAKVITAISRYYKRNWIGIETNGPGLATFDLCVENYDLENLFMMPKFDKAVNAVSYDKGWKTTSASRNMLIAGIKEWLINGEGWCDIRCTKEMTTFVKDKNGKAQAKKGTFDDEVISLGICLQVAEIVPVEEDEEERRLRPDGLDERLFKIEDLPQKEIKTVHDYCLETISQKKDPEYLEQQFYQLHY